MANPATRISFLQFLFFAGLGAVVARSAQLQLFEGARWSKEAARTRTATRSLAPRRGTIYDRNGTPFAVSQEFYRVGVAAWEVPPKQRDRVASLLVRELDKTSFELEIVDFDAPHASVCASIAGWAHRMLELTGAKNATCEHIECRARGDARCVFALRWS